VATAAPYRPKSDSEIIETLPAGTAPAADRATRALRAAVARDPHNLDLALRLAGLYVTRARIDSDPRQLGRAQAVLAPWWDAADSPVPVLVLRATIEQSNHVFADARAHLERALAQQPTNAQAWLTLATVQQVTGDLAGAAASCGRLPDIAVMMVVATCQSSVDGLTGRSTQAYDALNRVLAQSSGSQAVVSLRSWATTSQAEIAERLGRSDDAQRLYRVSRALDPHDAYTIAAYADLLLDEQRYADVIELIPRDTPVDTLLLRRVQAAIRSGATDAASSADDLGQRFAALRARGDRVHLREEARYTLEILHSPDAALALALENWHVQKEPLDARIALECALAAHKPQAARDVIETIASTHLESQRIAELVREAAKP
ncbi:MAG TPA: tetratricopeptide repeat protein, partial [Rhodanobacteraceae bacterium]|jgi:tetratricopeptide (TPR) repeat protein|nr:tetratricopeptide repeat protein [Rhodanobacteraceae bacterium]